jgi:hypothetical protein
MKKKKIPNFSKFLCRKIAKFRQGKKKKKNTVSHCASLVGVKLWGFVAVLGCSLVLLALATKARILLCSDSL